jgi:hypothetical protein
MRILPLPLGFPHITVITRQHLPTGFTPIVAWATGFIVAHITGIVNGSTVGAGKPDGTHLEAFFQPVPEAIFTPRILHELAVFFLG